MGNDFKTGCPVYGLRINGLGICMSARGKFSRTMTLQGVGGVHMALDIGIFDSVEGFVHIIHQFRH